MKKQLLLLWIIGFAISANAQNTDHPIVGQPCPVINFSQVAYNNESTFSLGDYKGKWVILDFWNRYCSVCLQRMPGKDSLQKKFKDQVKVVLVGYTGSMYTHHTDEKGIKSLYDRIRKENTLDLPIAYDSVMFHRFNIGPCPYIIVIDPDGIVQAVTTEIDQRQFAALLKGKKPKFDKAVNRKGI